MESGKATYPSEATPCQLRLGRLVMVLQVRPLLVERWTVPVLVHAMRREPSLVHRIRQHRAQQGLGRYQHGSNDMLWQ